MCGGQWYLRSCAAGREPFPSASTALVAILVVRHQLLSDHLQALQGSSLRASLRIVSRTLTAFTLQRRGIQQYPHTIDPWSDVSRDRLSAMYSMGSE
eukprot:2497929-Rhodomonas_salina.1